jgi:putative membrane protein
LPSSRSKPDYSSSGWAKKYKRKHGVARKLEIGITILAIPLSIETILGTAISILLGFRTGAAYERWWEARKIWGSIINESRTLIRQAIGLISSDNTKENEVYRLVRYQIAWCYALTSSLRNLPLSSEVKSKLSTEEYTRLSSHVNTPNAILKFMQEQLARLFRAGKVDSYHFALMDQTLRALCDKMGKCERIKNRVFPVYYSFITQMAIIIFALLLPFSLVEKVGAYLVTILFVLGFIWQSIASFILL